VTVRHEDEEDARNDLLCSFLERVPGGPFCGNVCPKSWSRLWGPALGFDASSQDSAGRARLDR
jgi:hypothetical protein